MEEEFSTLIDTFLKDSAQRLQVLKHADDTQLILEAAHSFKGSSSNMGAIRLAELCHELEQRAKTHDLSENSSLIADIEHEFALVRPLYEAQRQCTYSSSATVRPY
jgi:HPt (histidine-containing phosphotransfer) domain-containing protein